VLSLAGLLRLRFLVLDFDGDGELGIEVTGPPANELQPDLIAAAVHR
jgi:hypothetical protein